MAQMYRIPPLLEDMAVKPNVSMYRMESIHGPMKLPYNAEENYTVSEPVKDLEKKQLEFIKNLVDFKMTLEECLASDVFKLGFADDKSSRASGKAEKKATKKQARAANKSVTTANKDLLVPDNDAVLPFLPPNNSAFSLNDSISQNFTIRNYGNPIPKTFEGILECAVVDVKWLSSLIKLGRLRGIHIGPKAEGNGSIHFRTTKEAVRLSGVTLSPLVGRVEVWKELGRLLQVYDPLDSVSAFEIHKWLVLADSFLKNELDFNQFYRPINRRLSEADLLASASSVLLPDLLLKDLIGAHVVASNTELWINRVNKTMT